MSDNLDTLRKTVENAGEAWADGEHIDIITPPVVLELITEIESLRTRFNGMRAGRDSERSRADKNANALERMEQRALGAEANLEAALNVSRDRLSRLEQAEQAVQRVRELHERIPVVVNGRWEIDHCKFCYKQDFSSDDAVWPCPTIRALDGES